MTCDEIVQIATHIGLGLLESGAEAYRVENSVHYVVDAYDLGTCQVFSIPNYLHIDLTGHDGLTYSNMSRASSLKSVDLAKMNALNDLCRTIAEKKPDAETIRKRLKVIDATPQYSLAKQILAYAVGSAGFALFWGGVFMDAVSAALIGGVVAVVMYYMGLLEVNLFFKSIVASAISASLALVCVHTGFGFGLSEIIIGVSMTLLPGLMLTNFMREIIVGDWLSGIIKLVEALLIATGIALGAGIILSLFGGV